MDVILSYGSYKEENAFSNYFVCCISFYYLISLWEKKRKTQANNNQKKIALIKACKKEV